MKQIKEQLKAGGKNATRSSARLESAAVAKKSSRTATSIIGRAYLFPISENESCIPIIGLDLLASEFMLFKLSITKARRRPTKKG